jgi:DNA-3-methyladenine glycosylase II
MNYSNAINTLKKDEVLSNVIEKVGECRLKQIQQTGDLLSCLSRSIISQQLSVKSAAAIHTRFLNLYNIPFTNQDILNTSDDILRSVGISRPKISYLKDLATKIPELPTIEQLEKMDDESIIKSLTTIKGIGKWSVQMLLIFRLHRWDILPVDDLGIRNAIKQLYNLSELPKKQTIEKIATKWQPYRTIACWYLWQSLVL